ncbi:MAG: hypothetical protein JWN56_2882 [Sphingobacteriales bacterium]|nr:hypothetical protein [Sphingobacteriales bacterium]
MCFKLCFYITFLYEFTVTPEVTELFKLIILHNPLKAGSEGGLMPFNTLKSVSELCRKTEKAGLFACFLVLGK